MKFKLNQCKLVSVSLLILLLSSCNNNKTELEVVFERLSEKINPEKLELFKLSAVDSSNTLEMISPEIDSVYKDAKMKKMNGFLDSFLLASTEDYKKMYLKIAFHEYLKEKNIYSPQVIATLKTAWGRQSIKEVMENRVENEKIAKENFE